MMKYSEYLLYQIDEYLTHQIEEDLIRSNRDRKIDQILDGEN